MDPLWLLVAIAAVLAVLVAIDVRLRRRVPVATAESSSARDAAPAAIAEIDVRALGALAPVGILVLADDGTVAYANAEAQRVFPALRTGGLLGASSASFAEIVRRTEGSDAAVREVVYVGEPPRPVQVTAQRAGASTIAVLSAVTEDVDFEEARRTFSAAVSHELRTPLARILGLAETLLIPDVDDAERTELGEQIEHEVDGMRTLIDELLLLSALDRGRLAVPPGVVDASAVAARVLDDARARRSGRGRRLELHAPVPVDVPVAGRLCEVVVQNLVDNALLHGGPEAGVTVEVRADGHDAELVVRDDGVGIEPRHLPFVFQRFYRADPARSGPGSGLGLALVKHIVEAHGGTVAAESDGANGTVIRVRLPLAA